ncbi:recombinase family protein [Actinopolymorpha pittospori]
MNLKEWATSQGVSYATALRWYKAGRLPVPAYQAGRLIVIGEPGVAAPGVVAAYARVSSSDQSADLDRQVARVSAWATANDYQVGKIVTEILTSLCVRLHGRRGAANRATAAVAALFEDPA